MLDRILEKLLKRGNIPINFPHLLKKKNFKIVRKNFRKIVKKRKYSYKFSTHLLKKKNFKIVKNLNYLEKNLRKIVKKYSYKFSTHLLKKIVKNLNYLEKNLRKIVKKRKYSYKFSTHLPKKKNFKIVRILEKLLKRRNIPINFSHIFQRKKISKLLKRILEKLLKRGNIPINFPHIF